MTATKPQRYARKIISIALANPSSSFEAVTCVAISLTSSVAVHIAIERPLASNIGRSLRVADGRDRLLRNLKAACHRLDEGAFVAARRGDVQIIALRTHGGRLCTQRLLHGEFAAL